MAKCRASAVLLVISLSSCVSNLHVDRGDGPPLRTRGERIQVFVANPELKKELKVLRHSRLYRLTDDPSVDVHIRLEPIRLRHMGCSMGMLPATYTLGILPGGRPVTYEFSYVAMSGGSETLHAYELYGVYLCCIWELPFKPFKRENRALGVMLRRSALRTPEPGPGDRSLEEVESSSVHGEG